MRCLILIIALPIFFIGFCFSSPVILSFVGLTASGPIAGGIFSLIQSYCIPIISGGLMATAHSIAMR